MCITNHLGPLWWEKIGKSAKQSKLIIPNHFGILWWENIRKSEKIKIQHSAPFQTTSLGKDWKMCGKTKIGCSESFWTTLVGKDWKICGTTKILNHSDHFGGKMWEKVQNGQNWPFIITLDHLTRKILEKCRTTKIGHSESFRITLVRKIEKSAEQSKLGVLNHFGLLWFGKDGEKCRTAQTTI